MDSEIERAEERDNKKKSKRTTFDEMAVDKED